MNTDWLKTKLAKATGALVFLCVVVGGPVLVAAYLGLLIRVFRVAGGF